MALDKITLHGIEDNAVTSAKIGVDVIVADDIANNAITVAELQDGAVTPAKLNLVSTSTVPSLEAKGDGSSIEGKIQLNCHVNSHGVTLMAPPHSSSQSWTLKLPDNSPVSETFLKVKSITGSGSTAVGQLEFGSDLVLGGSPPVSSALIMSKINAGNSLEWGHANAAGYRSTLGAFSGGGQPYIAFSAEHGTNANTFRTRGLKGHAMGTFDNAGGMIFKAIQTATGDNLSNTDTMKISNEGYVTIPNQPCFSANGGISTNPGAAYKIEFNNAVTNVGSHYDTTNDRFTAPVAGNYFFMHNAMSTGNYNRTRYKKNGAYVGGEFFCEAQTYANFMGSIVLQLSVGDYVEVWNDVQSNSQGLIHSDYRAFTGFLIG